MTDEPQSLKDIIEQRLQTPQKRPTQAYRHAVINGALAGLLFVLLVGTVFLINSLR